MIVSQTNLVKRVVFPLVILPVRDGVSALFNTLLSVVVLLGFVLLSQHSLHASVLYLPLVFAPYVLLLCGVCWLMASLGVFVRDIAQVAGVISSILMFLSPVFYPASSLHEPYRSWINWNPLTLIIEQTRGVVLFGHAPDLAGTGRVYPGGGARDVVRLRLVPAHSGWICRCALRWTQPCRSRSTSRRSRCAARQELPAV